MRHINKRQYDESIAIGRRVEDIDRFGKKECTYSVYATIATCYMYLGNDAKKSGNNEKAAQYYKAASKYNRAFANGVMCKESGNCQASKNLWGKYLWIYE